MLLDLSIAQQTYTEDCEVCCQPIEIGYRSENGRLDDFQCRRTDE